MWSILGGLPTEYESMVNIIQAGTDSLDMDDILPKLMIVEQRQTKPTGMSFRAQALSAVTESKEFTGKCWKCGKRGHVHSAQLPRAGWGQLFPAFCSAVKCCCDSSCWHATVDVDLVQASVSCFKL